MKLYILLLLSIILFLAACSPIIDEDTEPKTEQFPRSQDDNEWLYIAIGDSTVVIPGIGVMGHYKEMLEEDLGVEVILQSEAILSGGAARMIDKLNSPELQAALQSANVITIQIPIHNLEGDLRLYESDPEKCGGDDHQDCLREAFTQYKADTDEIFALIMAQVDLTNQLVRAQDMYMINVTALKESGNFEIYNAYWKDAQQHIHDVATHYGIPCASVYDEFMGIQGTDDPAEKAMMSDITHPSEMGSTLMAELIRELGYNYQPEN